MIDLKTKTLAELGEIYNSAADRPIKKFQDKATGRAKIDALAKEKDLVLSANGEKLVAPQKRTAARRATSPRGRVRYTDDMIIVVDRRPDPKKITKRDPYKIYRTGITVADALSRGVTRRDINWDAGLKRPGGPVIRVMPKEQFERLTA